MNQRYMLIVSVWLRNNDVSRFEAFERQAARIMAEFDGRIERAIRISDAEAAEGGPFEIHVVSFPDEAAFRRYRQSSEYTKLAAVRDRIIAKSTILDGSEVKPYA